MTANVDVRHVEVLCQDARNRTLTRFANWVINPVIVWEYRRMNQVRTVRRISYDSVLEFRNSLRMINPGRTRAIKPKEDVQ